MSAGILFANILYRGAPDVKSVLPDPSAAVHVRDFNSNMPELAAYLRRLLESPEAYEQHRAWKRKPPETWRQEFHDLASIPKFSAFCSACDYAAEHTTNQYSEAFNQSSVIISDNFGDYAGKSGVESDGANPAFGSPLGFFDVNVAIDGNPREHRVDIPRNFSDVALQHYINRVCGEVRADVSGCEAIGAEILRLQGELTKS